ncbi:MAG: hypothetical protein FLDDKLPJ_02934 [Phycisphaerae bacterium]|nr:hypothetical protein [Phycisphaerae bacterium]
MEAQSGGASRAMTAALVVVPLGAMALAGLALLKTASSSELNSRLAAVDGKLSRLEAELDDARRENRELRRDLDGLRRAAPSEAAAATGPSSPATPSAPGETTAEKAKPAASPSPLGPPRQPPGDVLPPRRPGDPAPTPPSAPQPKSNPDKPDASAAGVTGTLTFRVESLRWMNPSRRDKSDCLMLRCAITNTGSDPVKIPIMTLEELRDDGKHQSHVPTEHCPTGEFPSSDEIGPGKTEMRTAGFFVPKASRYRFMLGEGVIDINP